MTVVRCNESNVWEKFIALDSYTKNKKSLLETKIKLIGNP